MEDRVWVGGPATNDKGKECGLVEVGLRIEVEVNEKFRVNGGGRDIQVVEGKVERKGR